MQASGSVYQKIPHIQSVKRIARAKKLKIYLVGGFLRDYLLGCGALYDFDFAVPCNAIKVARSFARGIKGAFVLLDAEHGCARVVRKKNNTIYTFDFADFREKTIQGDAAHRDFTINSLCVDVRQLGLKTKLSDVLIDVKGALKDLKARKIKMTSARSFKEDPLRLVRAFSLQAMLGFAIEKKTLIQIKKDKHLLNEVAFERIREEFFKILMVTPSAPVLKQMNNIGLLEEIIPQVSVMYKVNQGGYHHLDVWTHSLETLVQLEKVYEEFNKQQIRDYLNEELSGNHTRLAIMKLAALLHDIGKPDARKVEKKRTLFYGHERIGKDITRKIALMLKLSTKERYALEDMVFWHLRPGYLSNFKMPTQRAIFRYFRDTKEEGVSILLLSLADQRATRGPLTSKQDQKHHEKIIKHLIKCYYDKKDEKPLKRLVTGDDLIQRLRLKPSPLFAVILRDIEEKQATARIKTKKEALALARRIAKKYK